MLLTHISENKEILRKIWKATDLDKNTPHHIAAKAKNLDILKVTVILCAKLGSSFIPIDAHAIQFILS